MSDRTRRIRVIRKTEYQEPPACHPFSIHDSTIEAVEPKVREVQIQGEFRQMED